MRSKGPSLALDWEVALFRGVRRLFRALVHRDRPATHDEARCARLAGNERHLTLLAQIVGEAPLSVRASAGAGGVVGSTVYLPRVIDLGPTPADNTRLYVLRTMIASAMRRTGIRKEEPANPIARVRLEVERVEKAIRWLEADLEGFTEAYATACQLVLATRANPNALLGDAAVVETLRRASLLRGAGCDVAASAAPPSDPSISEPVVLWGEQWCGDPLLDSVTAPNDLRPPEPGAAQADAPPIENVSIVELDTKELEDAVLNHSFEKVDTADEYQGGARNLDGSDELAEHQEALEEVRLGKVVRSDEPVHAILRADVGMGASVPNVETVERGERGILYGEWDGRHRRYLPGWCTIYPAPFALGDPAWAKAALSKNRRLVAKLTRTMEAQRSRLEPRRGQPDGESIDLDAAVRHLAARGAMEVGAPRLYIRKARPRRDVATTVLLDVSLSSDAWVDDRRVLDVSREAALVLGEVAEALGDSLQILCFASHTRNRCRVWEVRGWDTPWSIGRARLGALFAQGYTRIGPALRHATAGLAERRARHRLLLLLSDGKPTDYDRYEGRHGIADVRQAAREADRVGVRVHGLTVDKAAQDYLPAMLGPGRWHIVRSVDDLPLALTTVYAGLVG